MWMTGREEGEEGMGKASYSCISLYISFIIVSCIWSRWAGFQRGPQDTHISEHSIVNSGTSSWVLMAIYVI